jgi:hypothetical protein
MKKVLIISYFFPPCNLTASQRIAGWATYLSNFGYYPIIVTRNWDIPINSAEDASLSTGSEIIHDKNEVREVFYLPYIASKRDEIFTKHRENRSIQKMSKILTYKELLFESVSNSVIPSSNMYEFSRTILKEDKSVKALLISAKPYIHFKFGYLLSKEFGIKWIADYRDDWNTSELEWKKGFLMNFIAKIQSKCERKWLKNAACITSVSKVYTERISKFVNKEGFVLLNGFDEGDMGKEDVKSGSFNILYNGSLYRTQPIEFFLEAVKRIISDTSILIEPHIYFPGLSFHSAQEKRVRNYMKGYEKFVHITNRVPKKEVIKLQQISDLLVMISHEGFKGVPSSKLYEYVGQKKQILLFPNDKDIIEETLLNCGLGLICNSEDEIFESLLRLIKEKQEGKKPQLIVNLGKINFYSRKNQTAELAKILNKMID